MRAGVARSPAEVGRLTRRQIDVLFQECQSHEKASRRSHIADTNVAFAGGHHAKKQLRQLE